jgi:hypothetical protein
MFSILLVVEVSSDIHQMPPHFVEITFTAMKRDHSAGHASSGEDRTLCGNRPKAATAQCA